MRIRTRKQALMAIMADSFALQRVPESLMTEEICLSAVRKNGQALFDVPQRLRTTEICVAAVEQFGNLLMFVPAGVRSQVVELVFQKVGETCRWEMLRASLLDEELGDSLRQILALDRGLAERHADHEAVGNNQLLIHSILRELDLSVEQQTVVTEMPRVRL